MAALPGIIVDGDRPLWPALKGMFDWLFRVYLPLVIPEVAIARRILEAHPPALIISSDVADRHARIYTLLAGLIGIPTLEIMPGPCGVEGIEWQFFTSDRVAAAENSSRDALLAFGVPAETITVTGSPRYDALPAASAADVASMRASLGVPASSAMVLFASSYSLEGYEWYSDPAVLNLMKRAVFQAAEDTAGVCLVVKPHPLEGLGQTTGLARESRNIRLLIHGLTSGN